MITGLVSAPHSLDSPKLESRRSTSEQEPFIAQTKAETSKTEDYIQAFIDNKMVRKVFPDTMNWINVIGNILSFGSYTLGFGEGAKKVTQTMGAIATKAFLISTAVINVVERCYSKNFLSALGYFNDILIASLVGQDHMYLARGTASGTYNLANALCNSNDKHKFSSFDEHVKYLGKGLKKFFNNLFSPNILSNFLDSKNAMFATVGGMFANLGALSWMFSGKEKLATTIRDIAGVVMDVEQLNPGHLKTGYKNYFWSGIFLAVGTACDWLAKIFPKQKDGFVPLTFILDGIGRHLLRLHQNQEEIEKQKTPLKSVQLAPVAQVDEKQSRREMESLAQLAA